MKDEHVKDASQDMAGDITQDVVEDVFGAVERTESRLRECVVQSDWRRRGVLGAAEDGSVKVLVVARVIFQWRNPRPTNACRPPRCP